MRYKPISVQLGENLEEWKGVRWVVTLHVTSRRIVESVNATAFVQFDNGDMREGFSSDVIGPFDDLIEVVRSVLTDAALASTMREISLDQLVLPIDDTPR
jgi:hypothetical protein